jgi:hypothetical protein
MTAPLKLETAAAVLRFMNSIRVLRMFIRVIYELCLRSVKKPMRGS